MAQLGLVTSWQGRALDLEAALRFVEAQASQADYTRAALAIVDRCRTALSPIEDDRAEADQIIEALSTSKEKSCSAK
jgi:hypothetical protein